MKSTIMKLKEKTKMWISPKHELHNEDIAFRRYYGAAMLLQTQLSEEIIPVDNFELMRLFTFGLHFGREDVKEVIRLSKNKEQVLEKILELLDTPKKQTLFLMDLYNMSYTGYDFGEKESQAIDIYGELLHFPKTQQRLIGQIIKEAMNHQMDECMKTYSNMMQFKMACTLENVRYYIPELEYTTVADTASFYPGKDVSINGQCEIREQIDVPEGCCFKIHNAHIKCHAPIVMRGGKLEIINSEIEYMSGDFKSLITMVSKGDVIVHNSQFYCRNHCGALMMSEGGNMSVTESSFYETNFSSAISFSGNEISVKHCNFYDCFLDSKGAGIYVKKGKGIISKCHFMQCMAEYGGAICAKYPIRIMDCIFTGCHARKLGFSIYYYGIGQGNITKSVFEHTADDREEIVQEVETEEQMAQLSEIKLSTRFRKIVTFERNQYIYMHDVHLYLGNTLYILGGMLMEHCIVSAYEFYGEDLINVANGSPIEIKNSVLDGHSQFGILAANGTKVTISASTIKNSNKGRAVYNSVDLTCRDSVFSNCLDGAIYGSRAFIKDTIFVNCRSKRGAGCYLAGNKGLIKQCTFERCVATISGGAVSFFGNYQIEKCEFKECEPNDRD